MAKPSGTYYRNYDGSDTTAYNLTSPLPSILSIDDIGWTAPTGKMFVQWNTAQDGSGTGYNPGEGSSSDSILYAIWQAIPIPYLTNDQELTSIANAIRTKGGTSASLEYPTGFISAIQAISGGGSTKQVTISLSEPSSPSYFGSFTIYETINGVKGEQIGSISSASGSTTVTVSAEGNGILCELHSSGWITFRTEKLLGACIGGVGISDYNDNRSDATCSFIVGYDGTINIQNIEWDD